MKMYGIVDTLDDTWYDFEAEDFTFDFSEKCLLPSEPMASDFLDDELDSNGYKVIAVVVESLFEDGSIKTYAHDEWEQ